MKMRPIVKNSVRGMTSFERLSIYMSGSALILAILVPIISYFWLDPSFQAFRNRARLQVNPVSRTLGPGEKVDIAQVLTDKDYEIEIMNIGNLPAKDVSLTLQYGDPITESFDLTINPPFRTDAINKTNTKFVMLKEPIAPNDKIGVRFIPTPNTIWITNEYGERTVLNTRAPFAKMLKEAKTVELYANGQPILLNWADENTNGLEEVSAKAATLPEIEPRRKEMKVAARRARQREAMEKLVEEAVERVEAKKRNRIP